MKSSTIDMLRAYLLTASLAAAAIEVAALLSLGLSGVSDDIFTSTTFRAAAVVAVVCIVMVTKLVAHAAFVSAVSHRYTAFSDACSHSISVSPVCPARRLVILHLRFNRGAFELAEC